MILNFGNTECFNEYPSFASQKIKKDKRLMAPVASYGAQVWEVRNFCLTCNHLSHNRTMPFVSALLHYMSEITPFVEQSKILNHSLTRKNT